MSKRKVCEETFNKKELYLEFKKNSSSILDDKENLNIWLNIILEYALDIDDSEIIKRILQMDRFVIDKLNFEYVKCVLDEDEEKLKYAEFVQLF
jgi:hypothetical protein